MIPLLEIQGFRRL